MGISFVYARLRSNGYRSGGLAHEIYFGRFCRCGFHAWERLLARYPYGARWSGAALRELGHRCWNARTLASAAPYILKTPNLVCDTGALSAAENASASIRRVSEGAMMPSSHSRAVA